MVESLKIITAKASTRISEFAFQYARRHGRKKVTAIHKANIMKLSDGLFLDCAREVSRQYPDIQYDEKIVDATCMHLVLNPSLFDVLVHGEPVRRHRVRSLRRARRRPRRRRRGESRVGALRCSRPFMAARRTSPASCSPIPTALLLSAILMLRHIDEDAAADRVMAAVNAVLAEGQVRTRDLGGTASTLEYADAIVAGRREADFGLWTQA